MERRLDDIYRTVETARKIKYLNEKNQARVMDPMILGRVARNLFQSTTSQEEGTIESKLNALSALESSRWDFDFMKGTPVSITSNTKHIWRRVQPKEKRAHKKQTQVSSKASSLKRDKDSNRITRYLSIKRKRTSSDQPTMTTSKASRITSTNIKLTSTSAN